MASPRKIGKKSKHKDHHFKEQSITLTKRSKSNAINQPPEPRRTARAGAGSGGRALQLEKVGATLEAPNQLPKTTTTLPSGSLANLLAPVPAKRGKKKLPVQVHEAHFFHWCTNSCSHRFLHCCTKIKAANLYPWPNRPLLRYDFFFYISVLG